MRSVLVLHLTFRAGEDFIPGQSTPQSFIPNDFDPTKCTAASRKIMLLILALQIASWGGNLSTLTQSVVFLSSDVRSTADAVAAVVYKLYVAEEYAEHMFAFGAAMDILCTNRKEVDENADRCTLEDICNRLKAAVVKRLSVLDKAITERAHTMFASRDSLQPADFAGLVDALAKVAASIPDHSPVHPLSMLSRHIHTQTDLRELLGLHPRMGESHSFCSIGVPIDGDWEAFLPNAFDVTDFPSDVCLTQHIYASRTRPVIFFSTPFAGLTTYTEGALQEYGSLRDDNGAPIPIEDFVVQAARVFTQPPPSNVPDYISWLAQVRQTSGEVLAWASSSPAAGDPPGVHLGGPPPATSVGTEEPPAPHYDHLDRAEFQFDRGRGEGRKRWEIVRAIRRDALNAMTRLCSFSPSMPPALVRLQRHLMRSLSFPPATPHYTHVLSPVSDVGEGLLVQMAWALRSGFRIGPALTHAFTIVLAIIGGTGSFADTKTRAKAVWFLLYGGYDSGKSNILGLVQEILQWLASMPSDTSQGVPQTMDDNGLLVLKTIMRDEAIERDKDGPERGGGRREALWKSLATCSGETPIIIQKSSPGGVQVEFSKAVIGCSVTASNIRPDNVERPRLRTLSLNSPIGEARDLLYRVMDKQVNLDICSQTRARTMQVSSIIAMLWWLIRIGVVPYPSTGAVAKVCDLVNLSCEANPYVRKRLLTMSHKMEPILAASINATVFAVAEAFLASPQYAALESMFSRSTRPPMVMFNGILAAFASPKLFVTPREALRQVWPILKDQLALEVPLTAYQRALDIGKRAASKHAGQTRVLLAHPEMVYVCAGTGHSPESDFIEHMTAAGLCATDVKFALRRGTGPSGDLPLGILPPLCPASGFVKPLAAPAKIHGISTGRAASDFYPGSRDPARFFEGVILKGGAVEEDAPPLPSAPEVPAAADAPPKTLKGYPDIIPVSNGAASGLVSSDFLEALREDVADGLYGPSIPCANVQPFCIQDNRLYVHAGVGGITHTRIASDIVKHAALPLPPGVYIMPDHIDASDDSADLLRLQLGARPLPAEEGEPTLSDNWFYDAVQQEHFVNIGYSPRRGEPSTRADAVRTWMAHSAKHTEEYNSRMERTPAKLGRTRREFDDTFKKQVLALKKNLRKAEKAEKAAARRNARKRKAPGLAAAGKETFKVVDGGADDPYDDPLDEDEDND